MKYREPYRKAEGHWVHRGWDIKQESIHGWTARRLGRHTIHTHTLDQALSIIDQLAEQEAA